MSHRVSRTDHADLGFAWASLLAGAITFEEFKAWAEHVVTTMPDAALPPHMIELMLLEDRRDATVGLKDILGFWPSDPLLEPQAHGQALSGLAALRGQFRPDDAGISADMARAALADTPQIRDRFVEVFPFLSLPEEARA